MSTPAANVVKIDWKQVCPWMILFQTIGLAFHLRQIFVGLVAAGLIALAQWYIQGVALPYANLPCDLTHQLWSRWPLAPLVDLVSPIWVAGCVVSLSDANSTPGPVLIWSGLTWYGLARCCLLVTWTLLIGGLAGGILSRRAAFQFAREESVSLWQTTQFVLKRAIDYLSAPILPLCGVIAIGLCGLLAGWLANGIPNATSGLAAIWIVPWAFGVLAACLLFTVFAGWPMMVAAVSVNAGDGFDALSRGFGFVLDRWRYYAWCTLLMIAYGNLAIFIILTALSWGDSLASESISLGLGTQPHAAWTLTAENNPWYWTISLLLTGFAYSYFWSGMTLIYVLLRKSLDNAELTDIFVDAGTAEEDDLGALLNKNPPSEPPTLLPIIDLPAGR
ncbi:MAG: hypothetical protein JWM11_1813 [Planctomycetaceae bacterium]|nr:hypothetical protein [Planctomycetaceae bacterium]